MMKKQYFLYADIQVLQIKLDYTPTYDEFKNSISNRKFPYGF